MKHKKIDKKLTLKKETIALLNVDDMKNVPGGASGLLTCLIQKITLSGCRVCCDNID